MGHGYIAYEKDATCSLEAFCASPFRQIDGGQYSKAKDSKDMTLVHDVHE